MLTGYRLVFIGRDGHHSRTVRFVCADDLTATVLTERRRATHVLELWDDDRMVARFPRRPIPTPAGPEVHWHSERHVTCS